MDGFAIQHSVMARPAFKKWWTQFIPPPIERSTYVLFSNLATIAIFACWQPVGGVVWNIAQPALRAIIYAMFAAGWVLLFAASCQLDHFELCGLRQVFSCWKNRPCESLSFSEPLLYRHVRHPVYVGWLMAFWCTPTMTVSHLFFAVGTTAYILVAIPLEERDLKNSLPEYREYQERVPALIPWKWWRDRL